MLGKTPDNTYGFYNTHKNQAFYSFINNPISK